MTGMVLLMANITNVPHYSVESKCMSKGAEMCVFEVSEEISQ